MVYDGDDAATDPSRFQSHRPFFHSKAIFSRAREAESRNSTFGALVFMSRLSLGLDFRLNQDSFNFQDSVSYPLTFGISMERANSVSRLSK